MAQIQNNESYSNSRKIKKLRNKIFCIFHTKYFSQSDKTNQFQNSGNNKKNSSRNTKKIKKDRKYQYKPPKKQIQNKENI